jgi:alpha-tubulin suppressor-like RCC1 family protein
LGDGTYNDSDVPVAVRANSGDALYNKTILSISAYYDDTCAIASDNQAYCWGRNNQGQLGGDYPNSHYTPYAVDTSGLLSGKDIISVSVGIFHTCVVASDNKVYCWGDNSLGQIGDDSLTDRHTPVAVNTDGGLNNKTVMNVSADLYHTCAIVSDGRQYCWGNNANGKLDDGSTNDSQIPVAVELSYLTYLPINY